MYLTPQEKRRLTILGVIIALVVLGAVGGYFYVIDQPASESEATTKVIEEKEEEQTQPVKSEEDEGSIVKEGEIAIEELKSPPGSKCPFTGREGDRINVLSIVRDPDENDPKYPIGPAGRLDVYFTEPFADNNGVWQTKAGDLGVHLFSVSVTDGEFDEEEQYCIEIGPGNKPPVLKDMSDVTVVAGETVTVNPECTDPEGDKVTIQFNSDIVSDREWMSDKVKETTEKDIGTHPVTIICKDTRGLQDLDTIKVHVLPGIPRTPSTLWFEVEPEDLTVNEGETITLNPQVKSDTGSAVQITYSGWMTSATKELSYTDAGVYEVTITATDGTATIAKTITLTVVNVNRPPEIVSTKQQ